MTEADSTPQHNSAAQSGRGPLIERIIEASARNKFLVFIFTIFAVAGGIYGLMHTPLDAIPELPRIPATWEPCPNWSEPSVSPPKAAV